MDGRQSIEQHYGEQENTASEIVSHLNPESVEETQSNIPKSKNLKIGSMQTPQSANYSPDEKKVVPSKKSQTVHLDGDDFIKKNLSAEYKIVPVTGNIFHKKLPKVADIQQHDFNNCTFLAALRSIVIKYPNYITKKLIKEIGSNAVEVTLFTNGEEKIYRLDETRIEISSKLSQTYFCLFSKGHKAPWIKLVEKALVVHNKKLVSYEASLEGFGFRSNNEIFRTLLGCDSSSCYFEDEDFLKKAIEKGELAYVGFFDNNPMKLESHHDYEVISFGINKITNKEYVLISNPWNTNNFFTKSCSINLTETVFNPFVTKEQIQSDPGIIILSIEDFKKFSKCPTITIGIKEQIEKLEAIPAILQP